MRRIFWLDIVVFLLILGVGIAHLPTPFAGDQALNLLMGRLIYEGGAPYRDLWDLKHPGVFLFFAAGGALFGFNEIGIHLFELLWMLALAVLVRVAAGRWLNNRVSASLAPALTVGIYYAVTSEKYLTQTEALVGLPLLASLWCAVEALRDRNRMKPWLIASGLAAGVVMVFKIPYVAIPIAAWLLAIRQLRMRRGDDLRGGVARITPLVFAGAVPAAATVMYLIHKGVVAEVLWTFLKHPGEAWAVSIIEPRRLIRAARWFVVLFAPVLALATIGIGHAMHRQADLMIAGLYAWLSLGILLIAMQAISWWEYHFFLFLVPAGLLAARGTEALQEALTSRLDPGHRRVGRLVGILALLLLFAPQLDSATNVTLHMWSSRPLPVSAKGMADYHARYHPNYAVIRTRTAFLREPGSHQGPVYVIDTPIYYVQAGRRPALSLLAPWFHPTDRLLKRMLAELELAKPPYLRVSNAALQAMIHYRPSISAEVARIVPFIERSYEVLSRDEEGTWYIRRDLAAIS